MQHCKPVLCRALVFAPILCLFALAAGQAPDQCEKELTEAEEKYQRGLLDEAIALVNACLEKSALDISESERAFKLLGKAYHAKGLLDSARESLRKLLKLIPNWRPDPDLDTPSFQKLAEEVIKEFQAQRPREPELEPQEDKLADQVSPAKKSSGKKWLWIGSGGAVAAGTVAYLILRGDKAPRLPDPPDLPSK